ncbi:hypothetical protein K491DRAFT_780276 [Lophiostoma macrostomum CBS 122681]|uniref:Uncharacterized protein n=1 Tax=Lophiostoma macrostomum CBS 122681 TaxID=1314788 RepID=A0A6A6T2F9_9PLEO|nr:hypothetical protein K491DRAFT_780276 [Lophiostoma macrostomum CBS 122681]
MEAQTSPFSAHSSFSVHERTPEMDTTHLSGATMADLMMEPKIHLVNASPTISQRSSHIPSSKRCSVASTTKSTLRQSNQLLVEMLQNIQTELSAHRSIMLDIQHRVSHLEYESVASVNGDPPQLPRLAALQALEGPTSKRNSRLVPQDTKTWWEACQNFAKNSEPPMSATDFLRTPRRVSGIDWKYGTQTPRPQTPPATPPELDELPPLTPTSDFDDGILSDLETPTRHSFDISLGEVSSSTPEVRQVELENDIREHTVEIDKKNIPSPPALLPAPGGGIAIPVNSEEIITEVVPVKNPQRYYKGVKSLTTYKALMKHKATNKEHHVLIHFHHRKALKELEE